MWDASYSGVFHVNLTHVVPRTVIAKLVSKQSKHACTSTVLKPRRGAESDSNFLVLLSHLQLNHFKPPLHIMSAVHGTCDPPLEGVKDLFAQNILTEEELGASLCVNIGGKTVLDLWGGYADRARTKPWTENTITGIWSLSKCVTNIAPLILIDRGLLDPSANVAQYWPEFAANGKEDVKVWHVLTHSAGVPAWEQPVTLEDVYDVPKATERLAGQKPWWTPGTVTGYHPITQGTIISELIRRVTGKRAREFIAEEIAGPLGADFQLGAAEKDWPRIAEMAAPPPFTPPPNQDPNSVSMRVITSPTMQMDLPEMPAFRKTEMPGGNGFANARGLARILSILSLGGTVDGKKFLGLETAQLAVTEQISGVDLVLKQDVRFGMGFGLPVESGMNWIREGSCYWGGWGGPLGIMDVKNGITICYVPSRMKMPGTTGDSRMESYVKAIYDALGK